MIRRVFWLALGAVLGVGGYRKAVRVARAVSPAQAGACAGGLARGAAAAGAFASDVRDGMRIYRRYDRREAPNLGSHRTAEDWAVAQAFAHGECSDEVKDGR